MPENEYKYLDHAGLSRFKGKIQDILDTKVDKENGKYIVTVDSELSSTSTNPVQNKVIASKLGDTDISSIGDGTVTGAIDEINSKAFQRITGTLTASDDLDLILTPGIYSIGGSSNVPANVPAAPYDCTWSLLYVFVGNNLVIHQMIVKPIVERVFMRERSGNSLTWTSWVLIPTRAEVNKINTESYQYKGTLDSTSDLNDVRTRGFYVITSQPANSPGAWRYLIVTLSGSTVYQTTISTGDIHTRAYTGSPLAWTTWVAHPTRTEMDAVKSSLSAPLLTDVLAWGETIHGFATGRTDTGSSNLPGTNKYGLVVGESYNDNGNNVWVRLMFFPTSSTNIYITSKTNSGNWNSWELLPTRAEVDKINTDVTNTLKRAAWTSDVDLNTLTTDGVYFLGSGLTNAPAASLWSPMRVYKPFNVSGVIRQIIYHRIGSTGETYMITRAYQDNAWTSWIEQPKRSEVDALQLNKFTLYRTTLTSGSDLNDIKTIDKAGVYGIASGVANCPVAWSSMIAIPSSGGMHQLVFNVGEVYVRSYTGSPLAWSDWHQLAQQSAVDKINTDLTAVNGTMLGYYIGAETTKNVATYSYLAGPKIIQISFSGLATGAALSVGSTYRIGLLAAFKPVNEQYFMINRKDGGNAAAVGRIDNNGYFYLTPLMAIPNGVSMCANVTYFYI